MRGVAYDPVFRAKLMAMHQEGVTFATLSARFGVPREVLGRWWQDRVRDNAASSCGTTARRTPGATPARSHGGRRTRPGRWKGPPLDRTRRVELGLDRVEPPRLNSVQTELHRGGTGRLRCASGRAAPKHKEPGGSPPGPCYLLPVTCDL